ncbi:S8 family peptidase [Azospirillum agricola]|uniref:S8 family peptidase n=1 Tax=Azospirillum agricola TaxID=1720247 RepID=UPI000A0F3E94|nr:S8/S53 family peptidase [Azospirillum agricola]SMH62588.1 Subtilase family protein [Azospirillum lipoferum]
MEGDTDAALSQSLRQISIVRAPSGLEGAGPPARFLIVRPQGGREEAERRLAALFPDEPHAVSVIDEDRFVLVFPNRSFPPVPSDGIAAALGERLADALDAPVAEPDLPRFATPAMPDRTPGLESVDDFPPGCWVPEESELEATPLWALDAMKVRAAWRLSQRMGRPAMGSGIVVAQPDTGITAHVQLADVRLAGAFNTLGDGPLDGAADPLDDAFGQNPGHGTATASVLVSPAHGDSDKLVGSAPLASHMPIRALRSVWLHEELPLAAAVDLAVEKGAHVVTMSFGGVALPFSPLRAAIRRAVARNVIVMAAAGNCVGLVVYPARFSECLAIGGTDSRDGKWPGSCSGSAVAVSAPAQNVPRASIKPRPAGSVGQGQGTSFAVALTAGVAACWLAHHGRDRLIREAAARGETLQTMFRRLVRASARRPAGWDATAMGAGIVDAEALLAAPFDLGLGTESPGFEAEARAPADEMRGFLTELLGEDPGLDDGPLLRHGAALGSALLARRLDPDAPLPIAADLVARLGGPVAARLGVGAAMPATRRTDADARDAQAERVGRLRQILAFGKATAGGGGSVESAAGGGARELPAPDELSARLDALLGRPDDRSPAERADFEKAIGLIRRHGTSGLARLHDPLAVVPPTELAAIEAVVKADGSRPSLLVRNGAIDETHPMIGGWSNRLTALREPIRTRAALCGRIQPTNGHANRYCGTGILVDSKGPWVLSNFHVLQQALQSYPVFSVKTERGLRIVRGLEIDFLGESGNAERDRWSIEEAVFPNGAGESFGWIDAVLLRLGRSLDGRGLPEQEPKRIAFSPDPDLAAGALPLLGVLGFPNRPPATEGTVDGIDWGWVVGQLFDGRFGLKRFAPGEFYRAVGSHERDRETRYAFGHDVTTLRGSSGSLVFSLTGAGNPAFGLHFAGYDNDSNFALTTEALGRGFEGRGVGFP